MDASSLKKAVQGTMLTAVCLHAQHEVEVPPWRRREHAQEDPPAQAVDLGSTMIVAAITSGATNVPPSRPEVTRQEDTVLLALSGIQGHVSVGSSSARQSV